jgi:hypothetical protein
MEFVDYHVGITFKLSINNMDLKYPYEYYNLKFTIMAIDHIICFQYLAFKVLCVWLYKV